jgi:hypothetical protein
MEIRTTQHSVTLTRAFTIEGIDAVQPPGTYLIETDEEQIEGISFLAYRRVATRIRLAPDSSRPGTVEVVAVDSPEIAAALEEAEEMGDGSAALDVDRESHE